MKAIAAWFVFLLGAAPGLAEPLPSAAQLVKKEGQFVFTDGGSFYQFKQDGTFESGPLSISGRIIHGRWTLRDPNVFVVSGQWSWVNGVSALNDYRRLTMAIYTPTGEAPKSERPNFGLVTEAKIYKCYFVIEELVKIKKPL